jgi:hypothetical protein
MSLEQFLDVSWAFHRGSEDLEESLKKMYPENS